MPDNIFPVNKNAAKRFIEEPVYQNHLGRNSIRNFEENHLENFLEYLSSKQSKWTAERIQKLIFAIELAEYAGDGCSNNTFSYRNAVHCLHSLIMQMTEEEA